MSRHVTLFLCMILHAFTHALGVLLVPLYLRIATDLRLPGVWAATLIVTIYGLVYCLASYGAGVLADRGNRKALLGIGLIGNALAILAMGLTRQYSMLVALAVLAGLFGTLFHPSANALVPAHYPKNPGMAIGILGMGSGLGFFAGPQFAGWRAQSATWHRSFGIGDWQQPCVEIGIAGVVVGILFLIFAREPARHRPASARANDRLDEDAMLPNRVAVEAIVTEFRGDDAPIHPPLGTALRNRVIAIAAVLGCRDFAGVASFSLVSLYLQKAHNYDPKHAGFVVGAMMLLSVLANPMAVYISPRNRRLPALVVCLVVGGLIFMTVPFFDVRWALPILAFFQIFQLGSYAVSDAAILERIDAAHRGRVIGLFLTLAGTFASLSPWVIGFWTDLLGPRSHEQVGYVGPFVTLGVMMIVAAGAVPIISGMGENSHAVSRRSKRTESSSVSQPSIKPTS